jgi:predicted small metal-binding protein
MPEFQCGSPVCDTRISAPTKEQLMEAVTRHVQQDHHIPQPTKSILDFLEENTISESPAKPVPAKPAAG